VELFGKQGGWLGTPKYLELRTYALAKLHYPGKDLSMSQDGSTTRCKSP